MQNDTLAIAKRLDGKHNVCIRIIDEITDKVVSEHIGHNAATNSLLVGIGQYLAGSTLSVYSDKSSIRIPQYISLGTMGLFSQDEDENGLPAGIGVRDTGSEKQNFQDYMNTCPGFGSDGYSTSMMNNRAYPGLGPVFAARADVNATINCELISDTFARSPITYRNVLAESESEYPKTIDVIFSAMISTGALAQFREPGRDYIFITEAGLWSKKLWEDSGENGLLAGYRIIPPDESQWDMSKKANREALKRNIIKVGINQVVQVVWKVQLGGIEQLI